MSPPLDAPIADTAIASDAPSDAASEPRLLGHAYDDIHEYDNPLPGWWSAMFWGTIVFSVGYAAYYHVARWGSTPEQSYVASLASYEEKRATGGSTDTVVVTEQSLASGATDQAVLGRGSTIFASRCASCHTADGRGQIGPNLTDQFQLHGSSRVDLYRTIAGGVPGTAMIGWRDQLEQAEVAAVTSFVVSLRGKNLPGKPAEGPAVGPFPAATP